MTVAPPSPDPASGGPGLLESLWRYRFLVVAATLICAALGYGFSLLQSPRYEASAQLILADPATSGVFREVPRGDPVRYVTKQSELATSTPVLARASALLDGSLTTREIGRRVSTSPFPDLDLIVITASDSTPDGAAALADAVGLAYQDHMRDQVNENVNEAVAQLVDAREEVQERIVQLENQLAEEPDDFGLETQLEAASQQLVALQSQAAELAVDAALRGSGVELFEPAMVPETPEEPRPRVATAMGAILGLLGAAAFGYWRAGKVLIVENSEDPGRILDAPLLGEIPVFKVPKRGVPVPTGHAQGGASEAYHFVVSSLEFALADGEGSSILFTSASPGDGKTITSLNVAAASQRDGRRVILVDADLRARGLSAVAGAGDEPGLAEVVNHGYPIEDSLREFALPDGSWLPLVSAGGPADDPARFFHTSAFRRAMEQAKHRSDLLLVDSPPLLAASDTSAIAGQVDGIVLVVNRGARLSQLEAVRQRLAFVGTPLLGYVFNRASRAAGGYGYGYGAAQTVTSASWSERLGLGSGRRARAGAQR